MDRAAEVEGLLYGLAERDGCERYEEKDEPCDECDACIAGRGATEIRALRAELERAEHDRDMAVREAARRDQKWMDGLRASTGVDLTFDPPALWDFRPTLDDWVRRVRDRALTQIEEAGDDD